MTTSNEDACRPGDETPKGPDGLDVEPMGGIEATPAAPWVPRSRIVGGMALPPNIPLQTIDTTCL